MHRNSYPYPAFGHFYDHVDDDSWTVVDKDILFRHAYFSRLIKVIEPEKFNNYLVRLNLTTKDILEAEYSLFDLSEIIIKRKKK